MQQVTSRGHNRLVPVGKQGHPFTLRFAFKIGIPGEISKQRHQVDVRIQREGFGLAGQQLPDQFIQALGLLLDPAQLFLRCFRLLLGQGQRNPQARQGRAQFVGDVLQQAFLAVDTRLQLCCRSRRRLCRARLCGYRDRHRPVGAMRFAVP